jgi:hypothetical protein
LSPPRGGCGFYLLLFNNSNPTLEQAATRLKNTRENVLSGSTIGSINDIPKLMDLPAIVIKLNTYSPKKKNTKETIMPINSNEPPFTGNLKNFSILGIQAINIPKINPTMSLSATVPLFTTKAPAKISTRKKNNNMLTIATNTLFITTLVKINF